MQEKYKNYLLNMLILLLLFAGTFYFIFKDQNLVEILRYIHDANNFYIVLAFIMVLIFVCSESVIIHYLMKSLSYASNLISCIKYSFIGFFVSAITPSASGGQPAQIYYMSKDGISIAVSSLVLIVVAIAYKLVLIFLGAVMLITEYHFVLQYIGGLKWVLLIGIIVNIVIIAFLLFVIFEQSFARRVFTLGTTLLGKLHLSKNPERLRKRALRVLDKYENGSKYFNEHRIVLFNVFIMTIIQRLALFSVTYFIYRSFGLSGTSAYQIVTLQTIIAISVDCLPLPGGIGVSEGIFLVLFAEIFGAELVLPGMVLSRSISYYVILVLGAIITVSAHLKKNKHCKVKKLWENSR